MPAYRQKSMDRPKDKLKGVMTTVHAKKSTVHVSVGEKNTRVFIDTWSNISVIDTQFLHKTYYSDCKFKQSNISSVITVNGNRIRAWSNMI